MAGWRATPPRPSPHPRNMQGRLKRTARRRRPSRPHYAQRRRSQSASRRRARPPPVAHAYRKRTTRRRAHARPPTRRPPRRPARAPARLGPAPLHAVTSCWPWSWISPGSLLPRRPSSSVSRTPPDSTQSPVAFRPTGSCTRTASSCTQPPKHNRSSRGARGSCHQRPGTRRSSPSHAARRRSNPRAGRTGAPITAMPRAPGVSLPSSLARPREKPNCQTPVRSGRSGHRGTKSAVRR